MNMISFTGKFIFALAASVIPLIAYGTDGALVDPLPAPIKMNGPEVRLETVVTGLTAPNWGTSAPGDSGRLFVTDQNGILWAIDLATGDKSVFLDVSAQLVALGIGGPGTFDERGLLGVAFHPDYNVNGRVYTYTSEPVSGPADFSTLPSGTTANHQSVITEWQVPDPEDPSSVVDPASARILLTIDQPQFNHNGGALDFGHDGMLFIALGDGGAADDQGAGHADQGNGQDPGNILGTIIRIDPMGSNSANGQYGIPDDNPFAGQPGFVDEIFAYGFRNPFRFSFDMDTGDLYTGDVGQNDIEEVDVVVSGGNYGWRVKEGSFCFDPNGDARGFVTDDPVCGPPDLIDPVAEYDHDEGIAIIGGFVYRGDSIPALYGRYIFGDLSRNFFGNNGRLFTLNKKNIVGTTKVKKSKISELRIEGQDDLGLSLLGFGQDADGELYVLGNITGVPFGDTGVVMRITPAAGPKRARNFRTHLSGGEQVPTPVDTRAQGQAIFQLSKNGSELKFTVIVASIENVIGAHIHLAPAGQNGPIVLPLLGNPFIPDPGLTVNGILVEGTATGADLSGPLGGGTLADLVNAMAAGDTYVNVHTVENRPGEIRGQIR